ncbi:peptide IlvX [Klebsiella pneumoniae]
MTFSIKFCFSRFMTWN